MDAVTYPDPKMASELENWVFLHVNVDDHPDMQTYFGVSSIPVAVVMDTQGQEAIRWVGFKGPEAMAAELSGLRTQ